MLYICQIKSEIMLLVYRTQTRHRLVGRFKTYAKLMRWISKSVKEEDYKYYIIIRDRHE